MTVFIRSPYNYDRDAVSLAHGLVCHEPSLAQQQFLAETDINEILRRFNVTGQLPQGREPVYGDFTEVTDYHSALNAVRQAAESFMELPAEIRKRFENDPGRFLEFVQDEANRDEAIKLGLVPAPPSAGSPLPESGTAPEGTDSSDMA